MRKFKLLSVVIGILFTTFAFQSCKDDDDDNIRMDNQTFVTQASSSNMFEIEAGKLAISKGQDELVKNYGDHMVEDHTAVGLQMAALAATKGWSIPNDLQAKERANLNRLNSLSGAEFDEEFADMMIVSHEDAIDLFTAASGRDGVSDSDLKAFASSKLPALREHLEGAKTLNDQIDE